MLGALCVVVVDQLRMDSRDSGLLALDSHPGRTVAHLSMALGRSHSATVRLVDGLVRDGLAERRPGTDPRTVAITLTASGTEAARSLRHERAEYLNVLVATMTDAQAAALEPVLETLLAATATEPAARWRTCRLCEEASCEDGRRCPVDAAAPPDRTRDE